MNILPDMMVIGGAVAILIVALWLIGSWLMGR